MPVDPKRRQQQREELDLPDITEPGGGGPTYIEEECRVIAANVGWEHFDSAKKGTPGLHIRYVAVHPPEHAGHITTIDVWKLPQCLDRLADMALAHGYEEPFSEEEDDDLEAVFTAGDGLIQLVIKPDEPYQDKNGKMVQRYSPAFFNRTRHRMDESYKKIIEDGEDEFGRYLKWREDHPRGSFTGVSGGSSNSSNSGGSGQQQGQRKGADSDFPF